MAKAETFLDNETITVEILSVAPSPTGLVIVQSSDGHKYARHRDRLTPLDEEAEKILYGNEE
jgi:hypothetical protein